MTLLYQPSKMKRMLAFAGLALSLMLSAGCKKSGGSGGNNSPYYIKFKLSGVQKNFQEPSKAILKKIDPYYMMTCAAAMATNAGNGEAVGIQIFSGSPLTVNTLYSSALLPGSIQAQVTMSYASSSESWVSSNNVSSDQLTRVTITEMTSTTIKGTFTGGLVDEDDPTKVVYTVTEGEFNLILSQE